MVVALEGKQALLGPHMDTHSLVMNESFPPPRSSSGGIGFARRCPVFSTLAAAKALELRIKHHAMSHLVASMLNFGSPHVWSNWRDEAENKDLARLALRAHRRVWSRRLLVDHRFAYGNKRTRREQ